MSKEERSEERRNERRGLLYKLDKWMNGLGIEELRGVGTAEVISNKQHFNIRFLNIENSLKAF